MMRRGANLELTAGDVEGYVDDGDGDDEQYDGVVVHLDLTAGDGEGGAGGEASNHWLRDEVDQEAKPEVDHDDHDDDYKHVDTLRR